MFSGLFCVFTSSPRPSVFNLWETRLLWLLFVSKFDLFFVCFSQCFLFYFIYYLFMYFIFVCFLVGESSWEKRDESKYLWSACWRFWQCNQRRESHFYATAIRKNWEQKLQCCKRQSERLAKQQRKCPSGGKNTHKNCPFIFWTCRWSGAACCFMGSNVVTTPDTNVVLVAGSR